MADISTFITVGCWFMLNMTIGSLNSWVLKREKFSYPVLLTVVHMITCRMMSRIALRTVMRPSTDRQVSQRTLNKVRWLALSFCASVACGNIALKYIFVSFAQMIASATPLFTMVLMYIVAGKRYSAAAYASMLPMCGGVMLCTAGELNFNSLGFAAVVSAGLFRGLKSIQQARLLTAEDERLSSLELLYHMSGFSVAPLLAYTALVEYPALHDPRLRGEGSLRLWGLVLLSGSVSFFLNMANFQVTERTSALTLQVLGNIKVVLSIAVSLVIFGNSVSSSSTVGCVITLAGVAMYNRAK